MTEGLMLYISNQSLTPVFKIQDTPIVNDAQYFNYSNFLVIAEFVFSVLGIATNAINIRVFIEQGLVKSSTNIGLFSLSIFDLLSCSFMIMPELCGFAFSTRDKNKFVCSSYSTFSILAYNVFYYSSNWTTVYLSIERALCVIIPLKIKQVLRPKVTCTVIVSIFIFFSIAQVIFASSTRILWFVHPLWNATVPRILVLPFGKTFTYYFFNVLSSQVLSTVALFVVAISTIIMIRKLSKFRKWRRSNAGEAASVKDNSSGKQVLSTKDAEMVVSVTIVTCIFLVCLTIGRTPDIISLIIPGASLSGKNRNVYKLGYQGRVLASLINSSINFFFYIRISSRYKSSFAGVFPKCSRLATK